MLDQCPDCPDATTQLVGCLWALDRYEEADALVEDLLPRTAQEMDLAFLSLWKSRIVEKCIGLTEAVPWITFSVNLHRDPTQLSRLAGAMWGLRRKKRAVPLAEEALTMLPLDPAVIGNCVRILVKAGRAEATHAPLVALARRQGRIPHFYAEIAIALVMSGLQRKGLALGKRVAKLHPESLAVNCVISQLLIGAGKWKAAAPLLRRTLKLDPAGHGKFALMNLALISAEKGDLQSLLRLAVQANVEFNDADTRGLLKRTMKVVTVGLREREAAFQKLTVEHTRVTSKHQSLEAALAGYDLSEDGTNLEFALSDGEGWHIEFKECMPDQARDLGIEIAALSSQGGGGTIFLGVSDNGDVVGIGGVETLKERDQWRHRIAQIATKIVQPPNPVTVYFNKRDGLDVIKIWVPEGAAPIYYVGYIAYIRNLDESRKAAPEEIAEYVARRSSTGGRNGY